MATRISSSAPTSVSLRSMFAEPGWDELERVVRALQAIEADLYRWLSKHYPDDLPACYWRLRLLVTGSPNRGKVRPVQINAVRFWTKVSGGRG